jgi:ribokinase
MSTRIAVVGSLNMDLVIRSPRIPQPGETIIGSEFITVPGGKGANQAVAAARLGGEVSMIGRVGNDSFGETLLENMAASQVDTAFITRDQDSTTGVALIVVDDQGENSIVVASGANMRVSDQDVNAAESRIASADLLVLQLEIPLSTVSRAAQIAAEHGVPVVLNPAPARELPEDLLSLVDVLVPNETEAALLTGLDCKSADGLKMAAKRLLELGTGSVVITLGKKGALLANQEFDSLEVPAFKIDPIDTTAAGDAFVAGLAVHLGTGSSLTDAIRWGNAAGALAAMRFGAQTSAPSRKEVEQLIAGVNPEKIIGTEL